MKLSIRYLFFLLFVMVLTQTSTNARNGKLKRITVSEGTAMSASLSPDGKTIVMDLQGSLWIIPAKGGAAKRITDEMQDARQPVWLPDSKTIVYFAFRDGGYDLWSIDSAGQNLTEITRGPYDDREPAVSPDGNFIAFSSDRKNSHNSYDIWLLSRVTGDISQITDDEFENRMPVWQPDGQHISYATRREGKSMIVTTSLDGHEKIEYASDNALTPMMWMDSTTLVYAAADGKNHTALKINEQIISDSEEVFKFKASTTNEGELFYVSDGTIKVRSLTGNEALKNISFTAGLDTLKPNYTKTIRDFTSDKPRPVLGIMRPALSPDGKQVAFIALGDLYLMTIGEQPVNITNDHYMEADPAWSPDGKSLVYASDRGGDKMQLWLHSVASGKAKQLTHLTTQPLGPAWSPDGSKIAYLSVDKMWGEASLGLYDLASDTTNSLSHTLKQPGKPSWSADSSRIMVSLPAQFSASFREGTNQARIFPINGDAPYWSTPVENLSIDTRGGGGPVWSPDGTKMAAIYAGQLNVWPVNDKGHPLGPPRSITTEIAHNPTWSGDSTEILYQSDAQLKKVNIFSGVAETIPMNMTYTLAKPNNKKVLRVSYIFDGESDSLVKDKDIFIEGNEITAIVPSKSKSTRGYELIDGTGKYAIPGLIESHVHPQKDFGQGAHRGWLAYGITTVRDPGNQPYHGVEDREASEAGVRIGPRIFTTGHLMEWQRVYYKMGVAIAGPAHLEKELNRAKALKYDLMKSYVRLPDAQQKRVVDFAHHEMGVSVTTHEIYPASKIGVDRVEHLGATSRRGYSPKHIGGAAYNDALQLMDKVVTPTIFGSLNILIEAHPELKSDKRLTLYPEWTQTGVRAPMKFPAYYLASLKQKSKVLKTLYRNGTTITAGTDLVLGMNLHGEINFYVNEAGFTPAEALKSATSVPADELSLKAGRIKAGYLADIVLLDANPLDDIYNASKVNTVIANGKTFTMEQLLDMSYSGH